MSLDPKIVKKTQDTLGKIIKKPPLTDKLLAKPPFRFLHDIMTSVIKTTGFMQGLFTEAELNSENVKDKDSKVAFLQKAIDMVSIATKKSLSVKPSKIVAGHEPEKTNEFLQILAAAINLKPDNNAIVNKVLNSAGDTAEEPKKEKTKEEKKSRDKEEKGSRDDRKEKEDKGERNKREKDRSRDREENREKSRDREKEEKKEDRHREKEDKSKEDKNRDKDKEERHREREKERERRRKQKEEEAGKENDPALVNGETAESDQPQRVARPTSAKGSRRRREGRHHASSDEEDEPKREMQATLEPSVDEGELPPQIAASRKVGRPSSARPAPPRRKEQTMIENEPAMRLGTGQPANVIVDDGKHSEDEDETFVVEETAPAPQENDQDEPVPAAMSRPPPEEGDDEDHGGLVKKILETKKDYEGPQTKKTDIERSGMTDAQRRKQREQVQKEVDKLRGSIQTLTRSANPLGKIMDYVQEDLDSMQKELERWKKENKQHQMDLKRERGVTDKAIEPLKAQLAEVDQAIKDQLDLIAATKANISKNDQKIEKLLQSVTRS